MADFSKYTNNYDANTSPFQSVVFSSQSPLLEVELNEMQEIEFQRMRTFCNNFIGDGVSSESAISYTNGSITLNGQFLLNGYLIKCDNVSVGSLVAGSVYLKVLVSEVTKSSTIRKNGFVDGSIITNGIQDTRVPMETTRRKSIEYSIVQTVPTESNASYIVLGVIDSNKVFTRSAKVVNVQALVENQIGSASGSSVNLPNSFNGGLLLKELQGKSTQNGTPTPENKVDTISVGDDGSVVVKACGKNLLPMTKNTITNINGVTFTRNSDGSVTINGTATKFADCPIFGVWGSTSIEKVLPSGKYTLKRSGNSNVSINVVDTTTPLVASSSSDAILTLTNDTKITYAMIRVPEGATVTNVTVYPQLEYGTASTTYEQYKEQLITIPLTQPLRSVGSVYDRIIKKDGVWGVERKFISVIFDGSSDEVWYEFSAQASTNTLFFQVYISNRGIDRYNIISNRFVTSTKDMWSTTYDTEAILVGGTDNGRIDIRINKSRLATPDIAGLRTWLASNPVIVQYGLATPTFEPFEQKLQDAFNKLQTYQGITNVFTTDALQPTLSVSHGKTDTSALSIYANNIQDSKANKVDIPTKLPADGGNADTVGGYKPTDFNPNALISPRVQLTSGTFKDKVIELVNKGYREGAIYISGYAPSDTWGTVAWGGVKWYCNGSLIYHMTFYEDRNEVVAVRSVWLEGSTYQDSGWKRVNDGGNASLLNGLNNVAFMQHYPNGTGIDFNYTAYTQPLSANIPEAISVAIGLNSAWHHIMYLPHDSSGYGTEIAIPLNTSFYRPTYRIALGTSWQPWRPLNDNVFVQSATPSSPQTNDIWIW